MVFFCCDGCGETLKKNQVDGHAAKCRDCYAVSCVDCSVSFPGDDYRTHTSCISEAERYEKTVYRGVRKLDQHGNQTRPQMNKKLTPQEAWNQTIITATESAPPSLKSYMDQLCVHENVPRKEKQFRNFTVNSLRLKGAEGERVKDEIWKLLVKVRDDLKKEREEEETRRKTQSNSLAKNVSSDEADKQETTPKVTSVSESSDNESAKKIPKDETTALSLPSDKEIMKAAKKALKKAKDNKLKLKSLRKQVQESLLLKSDSKKIFKKALKKCVESNPKKMVLDGKEVCLVK
mmetsp:Transcript_19531/g.41030  ORF Transcript_19531/g.41030 Transcript_19531/m.41030 type:complete len:291 (+) Transcript_19531:176-1048(+)|eukprot:CAMPEP_0171354184 /NCGR_PEP_ID=MMETSP0878-20121228/44575_1 /TAXON_ID=67004 /ORGANISM="Thalassiosira weissflogii, Strain CCMP1336" /LENGTH=290 /DNA_ID=CAMNT_0011860149 /DNA_START=439 /DNA_END=1311 /DNA_ORIENTATION=-